MQLERKHITFIDHLRKAASEYGAVADLLDTLFNSGTT